jgi:putative tricarboxylic transport membrane protein
MQASKLKAIAPYVALLAVAAGLYTLTWNITYAARPGQIGPDFWPKVAIGLIMVVCVIEIVRRLLSRSPLSEIEGVVGTLDHESDAASGDAPRRPAILLAGIALTVVYAGLMPMLGFIIASFLFLLVFMYLGGVRSHVAIWLSSAAGVLAFAFIFIKVVYVSLPRGAPPFDQATQFVMDLLQVK